MKIACFVYILLDLISHCRAFDLATDYYTDLRRKTDAHKTDADSVNAEVDARIILKIVDKVSDADSLEFHSVFKKRLEQTSNNSVEYGGQPMDTKAELKAILICFSIALMNVMDVDGDETTEIIPFMNQLKTMKDDKGKFCFDFALRALAWILFGISESAVSFLCIYCVHPCSFKLLSQGFARFFRLLT